MNDTVTYGFTVAGLGPESAQQIIDILERTAGIHRAHISTALGRVVVDADPAIADPDTVVQVITSTGHLAAIDDL